MECTMKMGTGQVEMAMQFWFVRIFGCVKLMYVLSEYLVLVLYQILIITT